MRLKPFISSWIKYEDYFFFVAHLELTLLDAQLTEEPVHYVARQEKDIGVAVLVHTHLHKWDRLETNRANIHLNPKKCNYKGFTKKGWSVDNEEESGMV